MTDRELMQQALDTFEYHVETAEVEDKRIEAAIYALRIVLAQPHIKVEGPLHVVCQCDKCKADATKGAEPVAWMYVNPDGECEQIEYAAPPDDPSVTPLYTTPPQRPWVGLTKEEAKEISMANRPYVIDMIAALEARLKEKNT